MINVKKVQSFFHRGKMYPVERIAYPFACDVIRSVNIWSLNENIWEQVVRSFRCSREENKWKQNEIDLFFLAKITRSAFFSFIKGFVFLALLIQKDVLCASWQWGKKRLRASVLMWCLMNRTRKVNKTTEKKNEKHTERSRWENKRMMVNEHKKPELSVKNKKKKRRNKCHSNRFWFLRWNFDNDKEKKTKTIKSKW